MNADEYGAMIRVLMARLILTAGGIEAAARLIAVQMGATADPMSLRDDLASRKGTISRRQSGQLGWPLEEIMALEDALCLYPVRRWLTGTVPDAVEPACVVAGAGAAAVEAGQAVSAALEFASGRGCRATALREAREAHDALAGLVATLQSVDPR